MNKQELRELDARIHELVFGIPVVARDWPCGYDPECGDYGATNFPDGAAWWNDEKGPVWVPEHGVWPPEEQKRSVSFGKRYAFVEPVPFYSSHINEAMDVVDWLQENRKLAFQLTRGQTGPFTCTFAKVTYGRKITGSDLYVAEAMTAPLAICLAAMNVVERKTLRD